MQIELRDDSVIITGYVNAVERLSRPIREPLGGKIRTFLERIKSGVFRNALERNDNVLVLLNHDSQRVLASTKNGNAILEEDNIGLKANITITDAEVIEKARQNRLSGWSFGFMCCEDELSREGENEIRTITDLDLVEVSILDDTKTPAYYGTSIEARGGEDMRKIEIRAEAINEEPVEEVAEEQTEEVAEEEKTETVDLEELANAIADIIIAKMNMLSAEEQNAEEEPTAETEVAPVEEQEEPTAETDEERAIDYSALEDRLNALKK